MKTKTLLLGLALAILIAGNAFALGPYHKKAGATSQEITLSIIDSATGLAETGVTYATIDHLYYRRSGTNDKVAITPATVAVDGAWTSGGFVHIDAGLYRLDLPNAALVAGSDNVTIWGDETDMVVMPATILLSPPADAVAISGDATAADNLETATDGGSYNVGGSAVVAASVSGNVDGNVSGTVTLANGAHGGAAATLVLSDYSDFKATGFSTHTASNVVDEFETQSQADPTGFHVNVKEVNGTAQTANDNSADINEILTDTGTTIPDLIAALNDISVANVLAGEVDNDGSAISLAGAMKIILSILSGESSGAWTSTQVFRDIADTKNRVTITSDSKGNRTAVTRDGT